MGRRGGSSQRLLADRVAERQAEQAAVH
jgi:hypothetical protein